jgi:hypothetical protein
VRAVVALTRCASRSIVSLKGIPSKWPWSPPVFVLAFFVPCLCAVPPFPSRLRGTEAGDGWRAAVASRDYVSRMHDVWQVGLRKSQGVPYISVCRALLVVLDWADADAAMINDPRGVPHSPLPQLLPLWSAFPFSGFPTTSVQVSDLSQRGIESAPTSFSTGLGLPLSRALAKAGGGWVGLECSDLVPGAPVSGTAFLPYQSMSSGHSAPSHTSPPPLPAFTGPMCSSRGG